MTTLPGYGEEDNAFYDRAIGHYERERTERVGDWPDHPQNGVLLNWVGTVRGRKGKETYEQVPYGSGERREIIDQGRHRPRLLTALEIRKVNAGRASHAEAARAFERWAEGAFGARQENVFVARREYVPESDEAPV